VQITPFECCTRCDADCRIAAANGGSRSPLMTTNSDISDCRFSSQISLAAVVRPD
jgi:hypothetical protein